MIFTFITSEFLRSYLPRYAIEKSTRERAIDVVRRYDCSATKDDDAQSSISVAR